jgi:hypothetical protein
MQQIANRARYSNPLFEIFVFSVVILWLPLKLFSYVLPFVCIAWFIVRANSGRSLVRFLSLLFLLIGAAVFYSVLYRFLNTPFIVQNVVLFFITYGTFWFLFALPPGMAFHNVPIEKYIRVIRIVIMLESLLAIAQVVLYVIINNGSFDASTGDIAQGTLNPFSFLYPGANFNNQIFTNNLLALLAFYFPYTLITKKGLGVALLGFVAVIFASVWHLFLAFLAALALITILFSNSFFRLSGKRLVISIILLVVFGYAVFLQPRNFSLVQYYYTKVVSNDSPKSKVALRSITELPSDYPWVYITGLGPGQYSSRAGLIGTGKYFGDFKNPTRMPFLKQKSSEAFDEYVYPVWTEVATNAGEYGNSTMARPFFSGLSIAIELGFITTIIICIALSRYALHLQRIYVGARKQGFNSVMLYTMACGVFSCYLVFISFFENYMEVAQAIFLGIVLLIYFTSWIKGEYYKINNPQ